MVERKYGRTAIWVFDRGIVSEKNLAATANAVVVPVGTPRRQMKQFKKSC
jgi:hypothetical protein